MIDASRYVSDCLGESDIMKSFVYEVNYKR